MHTKRYKGFIINANPQQVAENKQWTVNITIIKPHGGSVSDKPFFSSDTFSSKEEATKHCFNYGRQIIDGEIEDCSIEEI